MAFEPASAEPILEAVRRAIRRGSYRLSSHAEVEREADAILLDDIVQAMLSSGSELLEDYPDDPRGHSALLFGFAADGRPIHAVVGLGRTDTIIVITVYRPNPDRWSNWRQRRT